MISITDGILSIRMLIKRKVGFVLTSTTVMLSLIWEIGEFARESIEEGLVGSKVGFHLARYEFGRW
jgi:hypothetical protein